jgi:hypothetical protein
MPIEVSYLDADVRAVESEEVNIGTVISMTLPDGVTNVTGIRRGAMSSLGMELAGYMDKRRDEVSVRASEFERALKDVPTPKQSVKIDNKSWLIDESDCPDGVLWFFKLVQNW